MAPPDPELDEESSWSKELGQRLSQELSQLRSCSEGLAPDEQARVTLRLVYGADGAPTSQHVVRSTASGCALTECLKERLASVRSPKLIIDRASYDLALVLVRGAAPERAPEPPEPLADTSGDPTSCVDPAVARLSRRAVGDIVSTRHEELKACYAQALTRDHEASGNVEFEFVIGHTGEVSEARAREATLRDCSAIRCMLDEFRALEFPPPVGRSVRVIYPIMYVVEQDPVSLR